MNQFYKNSHRFFWMAVFSLGFSVTYAENKQVLPQITVESDRSDDQDAQKTSATTERLQQQASGETLGEYLDQQSNVDSASYGPGVGRPVVRGMTGYRVKILQNDTEVNDLSAMSQDHAVGVMPKASERIELLKGPSSLVYGANAGGTVRLVDSAGSEFPKQGIHGQLDGSMGINNQMISGGGRLTASSENFSIGIAGFRNQTEDYTDGHGNQIKDSDVLTEQVKLFGGWRYRPSGQVFFSYAKLHKDYAIPNAAPEETRIDMTRDSYEFRLSEESPFNHVDELKFDVAYSDYLHDETENDRKDGLFGQKALTSSLSADYFVEDWLGKLMFSYRDNEMKVCHEHGGCEEFTTASRSGIESNVGASLEGYVDSRGLPYSHGHPMPNTDTKTFMFGGDGKRPIESWGDGFHLSLGAHMEFREMEADPSNIQETWVVPERLDANYYQTENDFAGSLSVGLLHPIGKVDSEVNLSYLERLPSVDELYWNGIHHATDSYIFGNRYLNKERSVNLDWDLNWSTSSTEWTLSSYAYYFWDYIYQDILYDDQGNKVQDPFHLSDVWVTKQTDTVFAGASLRNDWTLLKWNNTPVVLVNQLEVLSATRTNGDNLPRTAPYNWLIGLNYEPESWSAKLSVKQVFEASAVAENETKTPGYTWVSAYADWKPKSDYGHWRLWIKGENLLDSYAQNHLSFLKDTAPLVGRQLSAGVRVDF